MVQSLLTVLYHGRGAWLQKNRTQPVIAQDPWFGEKLSFNNLKDLIPEDWVTEKIPEDRIQQ